VIAKPPAISTWPFVSVVEVCIARAPSRFGPGANTPVAGALHALVAEAGDRGGILVVVVLEDLLEDEAGARGCLVALGRASERNEQCS